MRVFADDDGVANASRVLRAEVRGETSEARERALDDGGTGRRYVVGNPGSASVRILDRSEGGNASGSVYVHGTAQVGAKLLATVFTVSDPDGVDHAGFEWQWFADGRAIPGATDPEYRPVASDVGKRLTVRATFVDDAGQREVATSAPTLAVQPAKGPPEIAPAAPRALDASPGHRSAVLSWRAADVEDGGGEATGFQYRSAEGEGEDDEDWGDWKTIGPADAARGTHRVAGLGNGTRYRFVVRAVNAYGESPPSPEASATPGVPATGGICGRTPRVRDFIVTMLDILHGHHSVDCASVTAQMLERMTRIDVSWIGSTESPGAPSDRYGSRIVRARGGGLRRIAESPTIGAARAGAPGVAARGVPRAHQARAARSVRQRVSLAAAGGVRRSR